jgi:mannosylfructose-phosphate synthase
MSGNFSSQRVLMISTHGYVSAEPELGRPDTGGQVVFVLEISKCLARMGYEVDILTRQFEDQAAFEIVQPGVRVVRFACGGPDFIPKETLCDHIPQWCEEALPYYQQQIQDEGLEIAFINSHYWDAGLAGAQLARDLEVPHIHTPHSLGVWKRDSMPGTAKDKERHYNFRRRIHDERAIYHDADLVVATTPQQHALLIDDEYAVDESRIDVIPPGFDDTRFFPVADATRQVLKRELGLEGKIVFAVGRMARNKGYDLLVQAMVPVCERLPDARLLLVVGANTLAPQEQTQLNELRALISRLGLEDRVLLRNYIADDELASYYRAADVFALSSRYEPFGMTAVEAMACGTPTVLTTEGGLWEQVTWGLEAIYANPNDTAAFGHAILDVLAYPQVAAQLSENGAKKARSCFTWNAITQQLLGAATTAQDQEPCVATLAIPRLDDTPLAKAT